MVEISFNQVSHSFGSHEILRQLTCSFHGGVITSVAGGNGSGKSTLLLDVAAKAARTAAEGGRGPVLYVTGERED